MTAVAPLPPPLVCDSGLTGLGARRRLRGPQKDHLRGSGGPPELVSALRPVPTTVTEDGTIRFGDSLCLLNYITEVPLQSDMSARNNVRVVDDSHSRRQEFTAHPLATGKVIHTCARNSFNIARADRRGADGYAENDLRLHYGQGVRILASNFLCDQLLHLYVKEPTSSSGFSAALLLPRANPRTVWRVLQAPPAPIPERARTDARPPPPRPVVEGQVVRVNERILLENVETGHLLASDPTIVRNEVGVECRVFAAQRDFLRDSAGDGTASSGQEVGGAERAAWSFVNETWADAVNDAEVARTGGPSWKDDEGDDFQKDTQQLQHEQRHEDEGDAACFSRVEGLERERQEDGLVEFEQHPKVVVCHRIFSLLRERGTHAVLGLRRMCRIADVQRSGVLPARCFEGILVNRGLRLVHQQFEDLCEVLTRETDCESPRHDPLAEESIDYGRFFCFMEGGQMADGRRDVVRRAYRKLRRVSKSSLSFGSSSVSIDDLMDHWKSNCQREVRDGTMDARDAYQDFLSQWEVQDHDGLITAEEFLAYYRDVSMVYVNTNEFIEMVKMAWDL